MRKYRVLVSGTPTDHDDLDTDPRGVHNFEANNEEEALDEFHATVPIACLDDFEIEVVEVKDGH